MQGLKSGLVVQASKAAIGVSTCGAHTPARSWPGGSVTTKQAEPSGHASSSKRLQKSMQVFVRGAQNELRRSRRRGWLLGHRTLHAPWCRCPPYKYRRDRGQGLGPPPTDATICIATDWTRSKVLCVLEDIGADISRWKLVKGPQVLAKQWSRKPARKTGGSVRYCSMIPQSDASLQGTRHCEPMMPVAQLSPSWHSNRCSRQRHPQDMHHRCSLHPVQRSLRRSSSHPRHRHRRCHRLHRDR